MIVLLGKNYNFTTCIYWYTFLLHIGTKDLWYLIKYIYQNFVSAAHSIDF